MLTKRRCCCEGLVEGQFLYGHVMTAQRSTVLAPCNRQRKDPAVWAELWVLKSPLGSVVHMVLFWVPVCDLETPWELQLQGAITDSHREGAPRKPGKKCGRDSSPELILLIVLLVSHKRYWSWKQSIALSWNTALLDGGVCAFSALTWLFMSPSCWLTSLILEDTFCQNGPLCPQKLLISLPCCDARVLQWDHTTTGA